MGYNGLYGLRLCFNIGITLKPIRSEGQTEVDLPNLTPEQIKKQKLAEKARKWRAANPEKVKSFNRNWRAKNPEDAARRTAEWRAANLERNRANRHAYQLKNKERLNAQSLKYSKDNPEKIKAYRERYQSEHREEAREYQAVKRADPKQRMSLLMADARKRCRQNGVQLDASMQRLYGAVPLSCPCCANPLDYSRTNLDRSPSIDRIRPNVGYTFANVRVICARCNLLKSNASVSELEAVIAYMRSEGL